MISSNSESGIDPALPGDGAFWVLGSYAWVRNDTPAHRKMRVPLGDGRGDQKQNCPDPENGIVP